MGDSADHAVCYEDSRSSQSLKQKLHMVPISPASDRQSFHIVPMVHKAHPLHKLSHAEMRELNTTNKGGGSYTGGLQGVGVAVL